MIDLDRGSRSHGDFTLPGAEPQYPPDLTLEPVHLHIALSLDVPAHAATGSVVTTVRSAADGARRLVLEARAFEDVAVTGEGGQSLSSSYDGRRITVLFDRPLARGEVRRFQVSYRVDHPVSGLHFSAPDEAHPDRPLFVATDNETERARYWLPCVDYPAVRTTLSFALTVPADFTVLANGLCEGEDARADGTKTARWRLDHPCPSYLVCFAAGHFVRADDEAVDGREVAYFGARGRATEEQLRRSFDRTPRMLRWMEKRLGVPYPFPKYFQIALPRIGGAMENISLVSWDDHFILDETLARELTHVVDIVNVHEMAHAWFGDAVVIRDFAHAWLKESWATYVEDCWLEDEGGDDEARYHRFEQARAYMQESDESYSRPIVTRLFNSSWDMYDRHLYPGGAWRIHMLRRLLGEDDFWAAVRDYLSRHGGRTVETDDFRHALEVRSGRSLGRFFDQWIHSPGYPKLDVSFAHDAEAGTGTFTVKQTQTGIEGKPSPFAFPLDLAWEEEEGRFARRRVEVETERHVFVVPMAKAPLSVRVDPDGNVLFRLELNPGDAMLRRALRHAPDIEGRILAAEALAKTGTRRNLDAVGEAFCAELFWGVRREMVRALATSKAAVAMEWLARLMGSERDPRVLAVLAARAGEFRDPKIAAALRALLDRGPTCIVAQNALIALGAQRDAADLPRLRAATKDPGFRAIVRSGAILGLAGARTEQAFEELRERRAYGAEPDDAAHVVPGALARSALFLEKRHRDTVGEDLVDLLRDPRPWVRMAAVQGLVLLKHGPGAAAIEAALPGFPEQNHPRIRRLVNAIRAGDGKPDDAKRKKEFEDLVERQRKLEERLDRLEANKEARS
jgi:aminopeptidase N